MGRPVSGSPLRESTSPGRLRIARAGHPIAAAPESMVILTSALGDLYANPFGANRLDIRTVTLNGEMQAAEEAAFADRLQELERD